MFFTDHANFFKRLSISAGVGAFIGFLAPFGMHQLPLWLSVLYWVFTCLVGFSIYYPILRLADSRLQAVLAQKWMRIGVGVIVASALMSVVIPLTVWLFLGIYQPIAAQFVNVFWKAVLIGGAITFMGVIREKLQYQSQEILASEQALQHAKNTSQQAQNKPIDEFMQQLPIEKRGKLLCMEMSDHYVKVYTDKGHHMLLMRFKDALSALESYPGLQTHRSWWVAIDAVTKVEKVQRKLALVLINELTVPVSKTYMDAVRNAGLLAQ